MAAHSIQFGEDIKKFTLTQVWSRRNQEISDYFSEINLIHKLE